MAKINPQNVVAPGVGAFAGIMLSNMLTDWVGKTAIVETLGDWTPVLTSTGVGVAGLAFIPRGSAQMRAGSVAFAGAGFGQAIIGALRAMDIIK